MKKIMVTDLKPGMRFTKPVHIDESTILVGANVPIKDSDIKRLQKWNITEVECDGDVVSAEAAESIKVNAREFDIILDNYNKMLDMKTRIVEVHEQACSAVMKTHTAIRNSRVFTTTELEASVENILKILGENRNVFLFIHAIKSDNDILTTHAVNATFYALLIGMAIKYPKNKLVDLGIGMLLINSGMAQIPNYIMHKQSDLTDREINQIKSHPLLGYKVLRELGNIKDYSAMMSLQHHEQFDGKGYPKGLKGAEISEQGRIASIADSYEALIESRSYRDKKFFYHAMKDLVSDGAKKFDPVLIRLFIAVLSVYPVGSIVQLNKKGTGIVIGSVPSKPLRPIVKLILDENGTKYSDLTIVNLIEDQSLYIVKTLDEKEAGLKMDDLI